MLKKLMIATTLCLLTACGGNSMTGTVRGTSLAPKEAIFTTLSVMGTNPMLVMFMADQQGLCEKLKANQNPKNMTALMFMMAVKNASGALDPLKTGKYTIAESATATGNIAAVAFDKQDESCTSTLGGSVSATTGTVDLTSYNVSSGGSGSSGSAAGTFDVNFGTDQATGSFSASYCEITMSGGSSTCI